MSISPCDLEKNDLKLSVGAEKVFDKIQHSAILAK